ncbi:MAG: hypothetical protein ACKPGT_02590 [Microcystis sp.]
MMTYRTSYPDEATRKQCLESLRETNRQIELYNLFLDDILAQLETESRQKRRERLLQRGQTIHERDAQKKEFQVVSLVLLLLRRPLLIP